MIGWAFLYAFLTFVAFIGLLIGVASWIMGFINRDRGWTIFGLRAMLIALVAFIVSCIYLWPHLKFLGAGFANFFKSFT